MPNPRSTVLADCLPGARSVERNVAWVIGFSLLTALLAQIAIPLPFTPVPITGQTFGVLLAGAVLGSRRGFLSQALYLAEGAAGLPVFAGGAFSFVHLIGPTGGYLWSYPLAAGLVGWLVEHGAGRKVWRMAVALVLGDLLILLAGAAWLGAFFRTAPEQAGVMGFYPFVIGDLLKIVLVGLTLPPILQKAGASDRP
jgi:biotin transport system substrate-specific component